MTSDERGVTSGSSPKGFVKLAEGFSPAAAEWRCALAAGLKPAAGSTKTACAAYPQNTALSLRHSSLIAIRAAKLSSAARNSGG